jgi:interferon gamma-inducible protein 30
LSFLFQTQKLQVEVYYEVLCPDSRYFILHQLYPAWEKVPDIMDIHFVPYGKASVSDKLPASVSSHIML